MTKRYILPIVAIIVVVLMSSSCGLLAPQGVSGVGAATERVTADQVLLVGTYTDAGSEGVYSFLFSSKSQNIRQSGTFITPNPTFLAFDKSKRTLYIANQDGSNSMATSASVDMSSGRLSAVNSSYTLGASPIAITSDGEGKVVTANYDGGSVTLFEVDERGVLGRPDWHIMLGEQGFAHPEAVLFSKDGKHLFVADSGQDKLFHFYVNSTNPPLTIDMSAIGLPMGAAPKRIALDRGNRFAYLLAGNSSTLYVYRYGDGQLEQLQELFVPLRAGSRGQHIALSPDGKYLYTSYSSGVVAIFKVDTSSGKLQQVGEQAVGSGPIHFAFNPQGTMLAVACKESNRVEFYRRNLESGLFTKLAEPHITLSHPSFILWIGQD